MFKLSRSPKPHPFPIEIVAELDDLCVQRERAKGKNQGLDGARRDQRIEELQTQLLELPQPMPGSVLARARLERVIQAGTFATVWRASGVDSGVNCAVEVFHQNCAGRGRMLRQFRQGIRALRALTAAGAPPSIVQFLDADDSQLAFSMTLIDGYDLTDIARRGWTIEKKMQVFSGVCEALRFAHEQGIIHRDIRPANILYDENAGCPVLTDFDLADLLALETTTTTATSHGLYAAPEHRQGKHERLLESDIYSLGRLLQYLITERNPEESPELSVGDEAIARIIATCTRDEPAERYGDVDELQKEVRRWRTGQSVSALRQSPHPPSPIPPQDLPAFTLPSTKKDQSGRLATWAIVAGVLVSTIAIGLQYRAELGFGNAAGQPALSPDAGAISAPEKKQRPAKKRTRGPNRVKSDIPSAISSEAVSRLFLDNRAAFQRCHSDVDLPVADLTGRVTTRFRVDAEGVLSDAHVMETSVKATSVAECVAATHNGLRLYQKPGLPTYAISQYDIGR
ncbi:MAG: protein kinase [Deltaproteobacteria bacterium]